MPNQIQNTIQIPVIEYVTHNNVLYKKTTSTDVNGAISVTQEKLPTNIIETLTSKIALYQVQATALANKIASLNVERTAVQNIIADDIEEIDLEDVELGGVDLTVSV